MSAPRALKHRYLGLLEELFDVLDEDGSGEISWSEFVAFQVRIVRTLDVEGIRQEFHQLDQNEDGKISRTEFMRVMLKQTSDGANITPEAVKILESTVRQLPRGKRELPSHEDGDDPLSTSTEDESTSAARQAFVGRMMERFNSADVNGDGKVTFTEFLRHEWEGEGEERTSKDVSSLSRLRSEFRRMDLDGDGRISREEFASVAGNIWDEQRRTRRS